MFDPTGGRIAQASIVMVNTATGLRYSTATIAEGRFALDLAPARGLLGTRGSSRHVARSHAAAAR